MTEHFPECAYDKPCPDEWRNARTIKSEGLPVPHRIVSGSSGRCVECEAGDCICDELRACEERVQKIAYQQGLGAGSDEHGQHEIGWIKGYAAALDAALKALYLMENMGGYPEFDFDHIRDDFRDVIDAIKEESWPSI